MKLSRVLILAPFALLGTGWLQADIVPPDPSHFVINLNDDDSNNTDGSGGWGSETTFRGTVNPEAPDGGFPTGASVSCKIDRHGNLKCSSHSYSYSDPHAGTKLGGLSPDITPTFGITSDEAGGGAFDFHNSLGVPITSLELDVTLPAPVGTETFTCNGGDAFSACGFIITDPPNDLHIQIFFSQGHVLSSVPEPSTWMLLGTAGLALLGRRAIRRRS